MKKAKVVPLRAVEDVTIDDIPGQLRQLADAIEAGECGQVTQMMLAYTSSEIVVRGWGRADAGGIMLLMEAAKHKLLGYVIDGFGGGGT